MKQLITIILTTFFFQQTFACLNGASKVLDDGTFIYEDREGNVPYGHDFNYADFENGIKQLDSLYTLTKDLDYLSDKGLLLILLERYEEAIELFLEIEKIEPNRYSTASNIGTAYELFGQNENALKWIKKSVELDEKSHHNSEWIHVKILEAKIKGEQSYTTNFLLNTEFGSEKRPKSQMTKEQLQGLLDALYYQLNERISFVKPEEKIVAQLLFDLGNVAFILGKSYEASQDYEQAKLYGYSGLLFDQRVEELNVFMKEQNEEYEKHVKQAEEEKKLKLLREQRKADAEKQDLYLNYGLFILGGLLLTILAVTIYRRKKVNKTY